MKVAADAPIGVFDSGVGGLTVMRELLKKLPHEQIVYIGDTAHLPYGDKDSVAVCQYVRKIVAYFLSKNIKMLVVACNSATAAADKLLHKEIACYLPVINVIDPMIDYITTNYADQKLGLIGTKLTVSSEIYQQKLAKAPRGIILKALATPLLVPLIEEMTENKENLRSVLQNYLKNPVFKGIKALILGCTHYSLIKDLIKNCYPNSVAILDAAQITAEAAAKKLAVLNLLNSTADYPEHEFCLSKVSPHFDKIAAEFLGVSQLHTQFLAID